MKRIILPILLVLAMGARANAQQPSETPPQPDDNAVRQISWARMVPNILEDQKRIWLFPVTAVTTGRGLWPATALLGATAGLIALDPVDTPYFRRSTSFQDFNNVFSSSDTELATVAVPLVFYGVSLLRRDSYAQQTALLVGEAVANTEILTGIAKVVSRRARPNVLSPRGDYDDTWFNGKWNHSSFFSGHAAAAFAIATVFARRYRSHRWLPILAYGVAGAIAFSRVTQSAHFPSDVFVGAVLGYSVSRFAVLRP